MKPTTLKSLHDNGLLFEINRQVLHPLGYALALQWDEGTTDDEPSGVVLYKTDDPDGIVFAPETFREGDEKFQKFIERMGGHRMAERSAILGFTQQTEPDQGGPDPRTN